MCHIYTYICIYKHTTGTSSFCFLIEQGGVCFLLGGHVS